MTFTAIAGLVAPAFLPAMTPAGPIAEPVTVPAATAVSIEGGEGAVVAAARTSAADDDAGTQADVLRVDAPQSEGPRREGPPEGLPPDMAASDIVFDDNWITVGLGAGLVPSYSGSDDYIVFPLPLVAGRLGGVGVSPSGAGFTLDVLAPEVSQGPGQPQGVRVSLGPTVRFRNDRADRIEDEVVAAAGELDSALELGVAAGVAFPGVLNPFDTLTISGAVRWDVLGAHEGMVIAPGVSYFTPLSRAAIVTISLGAEFVDDDFADYYQSVSPAQSEASGLPQFQADGGLNSYGINTIFGYDLDGNALNGGFSVFAILGYSRVVNDAADTPYTAIRGDADQWIGGLGVGYTF